MKRLLVIAVCVIASVAVAMAQTMDFDKHSVYIEFDKKVLYVDCMHLASTTSVQRILGMLPEMLNRPGESFISTYDVKINGLSIGDASDAALRQLQLADIEKIEVTESSASSYLNNGQGGSVNIVLRYKPYDFPGVKHYNDSSRFWGSATLRGLYQPTALPGLRLNWRNSKMLLHTIAIGSLWRYTGDITTTSQSMIVNQASKTNYDTQFVGGYLTYNFDPKNILQLKVSERLSGKRVNYDISTIDNESGSSFSNTTDTAKVFDFHALANYKHIFGKTTCEAELQYIYRRDANGNNDSEDNTWQRKDSRNFSGTTNVTHNFFNTPSGNYGRLRIALDFNLGWTNDDWKFDGVIDRTVDMDLKNNTVYLMPYLRWECKFKDFLLKAQVEFQYFKNTMRDADNGDNNVDKDFTGMLVMEQTFCKIHHIRLMATRKVQRPSYDQLCNWVRYMPAQRRYVIGDDGLNSTMVHEISLDYITRFHWDTNALTIDVGANYYKVNDLIKQQLLLSLTPTGSGGSVYKYQNLGEQNIIQGNFMAFCRVKNFSVSLAANVYNSRMKQGDDTNHHTYYNVSVMPSFVLSSGWDATLYAAYYSKVYTSTVERGDCALTQLSIGHSFGRWHIDFYQKSVFTGKCKDTIFSSTGNSIRKYDIVNSEIGMGVRYLF